ncbi:hypothetical protein TVAG_332970 [Trichomonas vaginalis G3]|uniref:Uncharacterized protein n=1 Tax=Trichomonas vaginalis (strain ATCC PRA-98 / G3) TaxID=412133 RepID=A2EH93_TRIV3|nr:porin3 domain-containing protein [Trichomonas vaginalis G3]EAY07972.1 hypothetical protein TVAG_332970 [Trichomonas vaginalis G3]KAI5486018.1 porin3 domain-containing protein [Trichomonas vaginalis G3]|eukprot:XP_001320195.1 hypothetical protein [Trichomonas vaginalis G3]
MKSGTEYYESMNNLFDNKNFPGIKFDVELNQSPETTINSSINIRHPYFNIIEKNSQTKIVPSPIRIAQVVLNHQTSKLSNVILSLGQKNYISYQKSNSNKNTSVRCRCDFTSTSFIPSILLENNSKYHNFSIQAQTRDMIYIALIDTKMTLRYKNFIFTYQNVRNCVKGNTAYSILLHYKHGLRDFQAAIMKDNFRTLTLRHKHEINDKLTVGASLTADSNLNSKVELAWIAKVNDAIIHSSIDTKLNVSTVYKQELYPQCNILVSTHLDHKNAQYNFGLGFQWVENSTN